MTGHATNRGPVRRFESEMTDGSAPDTSFVSLVPVRPPALRRVWRAIGFGLVMLVIWLSLAPHSIEIPVEDGDKFGHFAAYATLMFWFAQLDARQRMRLGYAIGFVALGVTLSSRSA
jgi:hypothetical protein